MFFNFGMQEMLIVGMVAVMLFGKRLPEVARSVGGSYREFRKGLAEMQAHLQIDDTVSSSHSTSSHYADDIDDYEQPTAPKFEPPTGEPTSESDSTGEPTAESGSTGEPTSETETKPAGEATRDEV